MPTEIETSYLVLRKTPYSETSLVIAGISPLHGQLHFMVRGGRRIGRRQFPTVDIFRLLDIRFHFGRGELHRLAAADVNEDFAGVSQRYATYRAAAWMAQFALANVLEQIEHPRFFEAMLVGLRRLCMTASDPKATLLPAAVLTGVSVVYLAEAGWLAPYERDGDTARQCDALLEMGGGRGDPPRLTARNWMAMLEWCVGLLREADCHVPPIPEGGAG